jgi:hypothetical protein
MTSIIKQGLLLIIGILLVIMFLQFSRITGFIGTPTQIINASGTAGNVAPTVDTPAFSISKSSCVNGSLTITTIAHDENGWGDIANVTAVVYSTLASGSGCTANITNCYKNTSCTLSGGSGNNINVNCTIPGTFRYFADNGTWTANLTVTDNSSSQITTSVTNTTAQLIALDVVTDPLTFSANTNANSSQVNETVRNCGNWIIDLQLNGTALNCTGTGCGVVTSITVGNLSYSNTSGTPGVSAYTQLTGSPVTLLMNMARATADTGNNGTTYWVFYAPSGTKGVYNGTIQFTAIQH